MIKNEWLLFSPLPAVWTCTFTCAQRVSYLISCLVNILTQDVWLRMNGSSCFHALAAVWTYAFTYSQSVSYLVNFITRDVWLRMNGPLFFTCCCNTLSTCVFTCAQPVSYFSLLHTSLAFSIQDAQSVTWRSYWFISSPTHFVNLFIHWTQDVSYFSQSL